MPLDDSHRLSLENQVLRTLCGWYRQQWLVKARALDRAVAALRTERAIHAQGATPVEPPQSRARGHDWSA